MRVFSTLTPRLNEEESWLKLKRKSIQYYLKSVLDFYTLFYYNRFNNVLQLEILSKCQKLLSKLRPPQSDEI